MTNQSAPTNPGNATAQCVQTKTVSMQVTLTVLYVLVFPIALLGNSLVLYVVFKRQGMRSVVNLLIVNMAIADLLVTVFAMPYSVHFLFEGPLWFSGNFGLVLCKVIHFSLVVSIAASVITLIVVTVDRFVSIVFVWKRCLNLRTSKFSLVLIWVFCIAIMGFHINVYTSKQAIPGDDRYYCLPDWTRMPEDFNKYFAIGSFVTLYAIPLVLMAILYSVIANKLWRESIGHSAASGGDASINSSKKRVIKMLVTVTLAFAICWFPLHVIHYYIYFNFQALNCMSKFFIFFSFWLGHANSAINPVLYTVFNKTFRRAFLQALHLQSLDSLHLKTSFSRHLARRKSFPKSTQSTLNNNDNSPEDEPCNVTTNVPPSPVTTNVRPFKDMYAYGKLVQRSDSRSSSNSRGGNKKLCRHSIVVVMDKITSV